MGGGARPFALAGREDRPARASVVIGATGVDAGSTAVAGADEDAATGGSTLIGGGAGSTTAEGVSADGCSATSGNGLGMAEGSAVTGGVGETPETVAGASAAGESGLGAEGTSAGAGDAPGGMSERSAPSCTCRTDWGGRLVGGTPVRTESTRASTRWKAAVEPWSSGPAGLGA